MCTDVQGFAVCNISNYVMQKGDVMHAHWDIPFVGTAFCLRFPRPLACPGSAVAPAGNLEGQEEEGLACQEAREVLEARQAAVRAVLDLDSTLPSLTAVLLLVNQSSMSIPSLAPHPSHIT